MRGALLVAGTGSDAGKSALVAGLCRWLARLDVLADLVAGHLDTGALSLLIENGPPPGLPTVLTSLGHAQP